MAYLDDHPPLRPQYREPRREAESGIVFVHTAEGVMDTVGPDTGAENVAAFIQRRTDPGSYHVLVDSDSTVPVVRDECESFQVAANGHNRHGWGISFACRTTDLDPDHWWTQRAMVLAGREIAAYWQRKDIDPRTAARWVTRAEADNRSGPGLCCHGDVQPADRSDAWASHPRRAELEQMLIDAIVGFDATPTPQPEEDDMAGSWHRWVHEHQGAQYAVLEQGDVYVGKVWLHPDHVILYTSGAMGPFDGSDDFANNAPRLDALPWLGTPPLADLSDAELIAEIRKLPDDTVAALKAAL